MVVEEKERLAREIVRRLHEAGYRAYFAGGYVRDLLLGRKGKDVDVATDAPLGEVRRLFPRTIEVGAQFGVLLVVEGGVSVEVARFRTDLGYEDGRHPVDVRFTGPEEDALRRDFTINGMFYDPIREEVVDFVGGQEDLRRRVVRAIGDPDRRFSEDRLRLLRAVRFAANLGFDIEERTFEAIRRHATTVTQVAWERIGEEIVRILTEGGARRGFELLDRAGLLAPVLPEVAALKGVEQSPDYHPEGDVFTHTMLMLGHLDGTTETLAWGVLLHDIGKPACAARVGQKITFYGHCTLGAEMAVAVCQRLKRSRATWERVAYLVRNHLRVLQAPKMRVSTLKRFLAEEGIDELLELVRIDALSSNGDLSYYEFCRRKREEFGREKLRPAPLLRGRDLLELGFRPGPLFGEILRAVEDAQLEGTLGSREEAVEWVERTYGHLRG
ncbi:MAG: HDIG domain-containing protein [Candidatus Binatia bacterium]|nr:MAG: HDIG domain-containing protein [Candidatus Binatia bacterium]